MNSFVDVFLIEATVAKLGKMRFHDLKYEPESKSHMLKICFPQLKDPLHAFLECGDVCSKAFAKFLRIPIVQSLSLQKTCPISGGS